MSKNNPKEKPITGDDERELSSVAAALCQNHFTQDAARFVAELHVRVLRLERAIEGTRRK